MLKGNSPVKDQKVGDLMIGQERQSKIDRLLRVCMSIVKLDGMHDGPQDDGCGWKQEEQTWFLPLRI